MQAERSSKTSVNINHDVPTMGAQKSKPLYEKYTAEQLAQLKIMTSDEKKQVRCLKCSDYFHKALECPNKGKLCYVCKHYGHEAKQCKYATSKSYNLKTDDFIEDFSGILDSGASHTFIKNRNLLLDLKKHSSPIDVNTIENQLEIKL